MWAETQTTKGGEAWKRFLIKVTNAVNVPFTYAKMNVYMDYPAMDFAQLKIKKRVLLEGLPGFQTGPVF